MTEYRRLAGPVSVSRRGTDYPYAAGNQPQIAGLAAVFFNAKDSAGTQYQLESDVYERIGRNAFDRCLRDYDDVRCLWDHNPDFPLGRVMAGNLRLGVTELGLSYMVSPVDTQIARDVIENIRAGIVTGSSFAFLPTEVQWSEENRVYIRTIVDLQLFEISPVTMPAYSSTTAHLQQEIAPRSGVVPDAILARAQLVELECGLRIGR
jgi:HK97 family phage prohead protease